MENLYEKMAVWQNQGALYLYTAVRGSHEGEKFMIQGDRAFYGGKTAEKHQVEGFWAGVLSSSSPEDAPCLFDTEGDRVFFERIRPEPELVICGGGHISSELAVLADYLEYPYTVLEERPEFAGRDRFPHARRILLSPFGQALAENDFSAGAYYVIVTRGHEHDLECLERILNKPRGYVGMIGSKGKVEKTMHVLRQKGYPEELLNQVHAPIGIRLGGRSPREIAVSIISELVLTRNSEPVSSCYSREMLKRLSEKGPGVLVKIVGKRGSAPREEGAVMLVGERENLLGTIGGGMLEHLAVIEARKLMGSKKQNCITLSLDDRQAASAGMWCGGEADLYFEDLW